MLRFILSLLVLTFVADDSSGQASSQAMSLTSQVPDSPGVFCKDAAEAIEDVTAIEQHLQSLIATVAPAAVQLRIPSISASGSGVIVSPDGYVLTAAHVIRKPGLDVKVLFADGTEVAATSLGCNRALDSGLIKIDGDRRDWPYVEMSEFTDFSAGQWCLALGYPGGKNSDQGLVSRLGQALFSSRIVLRTDCSVEWGDSGGPLFDMRGRVIGVHSRIEKDFGNLHVPVSEFREDWSRLIASESFAARSGANFGVDGKPHDLGVEITRVNSRLTELGIKQGDILTEFRGQSVPDTEQLKVFIDQAQCNSWIDIQVRRDGKPTDLKIWLKTDWKEREYSQIEKRNWQPTLELFDRFQQVLRSSTVRVYCESAGQRRQVALGTIVDQDGWVLTKGSELRGKLTCETDQGKTAARFVGYHPRYDLALLKVDQAGLTPIRWTTRTENEIGQWVVSVGARQDVSRIYNQSSHLTIAAVPVGVISARRRSIPDKASLGVKLVPDSSPPCIEKICPDTAAADANLQPGDVIQAIDGKNMSSPSKLVEIIASRRVGDRIRLSILRDGQEMVVPVQLRRYTQIVFHSVEKTGNLSLRRTGFAEVIQHDTVLDAEDCGGPLVGLDGLGLGINVARASRTATYSIPADVIVSILPDMKNGKYPPPSTIKP
jgi:serine protease Do